MIRPTLALVFDCDKTLTTEYMQGPIFDNFKYNGREFWKANEDYKAKLKSNNIDFDEDATYLNLLIKYSQKGMPFEGLTRDMMRGFGKQLELFPGLPEFFNNIKEDFDTPFYNKYQINLEFYISSAGLTPILEGSNLAEHMEAIDACEFEYDTNGVPVFPVKTINSTMKTRTIFKIIKGSFHDEKIHVNSYLEKRLNRIPRENILYFGDGPSDVPPMSVLNNKFEGKRGHSIAVYNPTPSNPKYKDNPAKDALALVDSKRADYAAIADYNRGSDLYIKIKHLLNKKIESIVRDTNRTYAIFSSVPPKHDES